MWLSPNLGKGLETRYNELQTQRQVGFQANLFLPGYGISPCEYPSLSPVSGMLPIYHAVLLSQYTVCAQCRTGLQQPSTNTKRDAPRWFGYHALFQASAGYGQASCPVCLQVGRVCLCSFMFLETLLNHPYPTAPTPSQTHSHGLSQAKGVPLTWSVSHSRLQVLWASTQRLGFMSLGQIPAWE